MTNLEKARTIISKRAEDDNEFQFAREVREGQWDHRRDVQAVLEKLNKEDQS